MNNKATNDNIPRLCYVDGRIMFFTNDINNVCGDNWDVRGYEYNSGEPHEQYVTAMLAFHPTGDSTLEYEPCNRGEEFTIEEINDGAIPWLYCKSAGPLYAGATRVECVTWLNKAHMVWGELELHE